MKMFGRDKKSGSGQSALRGALGRIAPLCFALSVGACGLQTDKSLLFDGMFFRTDVKTVKSENPTLLNRRDRSHFIVKVRKPQQSLVGAREAGRYQATVHCIEQYGTSDVEWIRGPDVDDAALGIKDDTLELEGMCNP